MILHLPYWLSGFFLSALLVPPLAQADDSWVCAWNGSDGQIGFSKWHVERGELVDDNGNHYNIVYNSSDRLVATEATAVSNPQVVVITVISINKLTFEMRELLFDTHEIDQLKVKRAGPPYFESKSPPGMSSVTRAPPDLQPIIGRFGDFVGSKCAAK